MTTMRQDRVVNYPINRRREERRGGRSEGNAAERPRSSRDNRPAAPTTAGPPPVRRRGARELRGAPVTGLRGAAGGASAWLLDRGFFAAQPHFALFHSSALSSPVGARMHHLLQKIESSSFSGEHSNEVAELPLHLLQKNSCCAAAADVVRQCRRFTQQLADNRRHE